MLSSRGCRRRNGGVGEDDKCGKRRRPVVWHREWHLRLDSIIFVEWDDGWGERIGGGGEYSFHWDDWLGFVNDDWVVVCSIEVVLDAVGIECGDCCRGVRDDEVIVDIRVGGQPIESPWGDGALALERAESTIRHIDEIEDKEDSRDTQRLEEHFVRLSHQQQQRLIAVFQDHLLSGFP